MSYVDEAFLKLKSTLEITQTESDLASRWQQEIRSVVGEEWDLEDDYLTGSYRRNTKTKPLKDVDILVVIDADGAQGKLRKLGPAAVLEELKKVLERKYDNVIIDRMACAVSTGSAEDPTFEIVPAFRQSTDVFEIPDAQRGSWILTNPKVHEELSTKKNKKCDERWVPFVKMIKGINREAGSPVKPSFLLEVMALDLAQTPFGSYQDEIRWFLASASEQLDREWVDPAGVGPDVNVMTTNERRTAREALRKIQAIAEDAIWLEDDGQERKAVERWRDIFGKRMPRP
jgi:hypothetical protein